MDIVLADRLRTFLRAIETGEIRLEITSELPEDGDPWIGHYCYQASDGTVFWLFVDAGEWDYIDHLVLAGGGEYRWGDDPDGIDDYKPSQIAVKDRYFIGKNTPFRAEWVSWNWQPEASHFRCGKCNAYMRFDHKQGTITTRTAMHDAFEIKHYSCDPIYGPQRGERKSKDVANTDAD